MDKILYVNLVMVISLVVFMTIAALRNKKTVHDVKGVRRMIYPACDWIYQWVFSKKEAKRYMELAKLYPSGFAKEQYKKKYMDKIAYSMLILILANGITITLGLMEIYQTPITDAYYIERNPYGLGSKNIELNANFQGESHPIVVEIEERKYTDEELCEVMLTCDAYIEEHVLGENKTLSGVEYDLYFFDTIEDYSVDIQWKCSNYNVIGMDGTVKNTEMTDAIDVVVTAVCSYFEHTWEHSMNVRVLPQKLNKKMHLEKQIYDAIAAQDKVTQNNPYLELPRNIYGENITWDVKHDSSKWIIVLLGITAVVLLFIKDAENTRYQLKRRDQLLIADYPVFVHKYVLLLGAGMSAQAAWMRMVTDYERSMRLGEPMKYVYEEMIVTANEIKQGITQTVALENFGHRCGLSSYLKFCSILIQSMKTGSKGMGRMLIDAADEATLMRRENAKRLGEEAGTKLLLPMVILLAVVMLILVVPAFMTMNI